MMIEFKMSYQQKERYRKTGGKSLYKKIIPCINCESESRKNIIELGSKYDKTGGDQIYLYNDTTDEVLKNEFLDTVRKLVKEMDIPVLIGCQITGFEDIKKAFYTGASYVVIKSLTNMNLELIKEGAKRFGGEKLIIEINDDKLMKDVHFIKEIKELEITTLLLNQVEMSDDFVRIIKESPFSIILFDSLENNSASQLLSLNNVIGLSTDFYKEKDIFQEKKELKEKNIPVSILESTIEFQEFKLNHDGLLPVVVQDYKSNEVLMMAYMDEEAYYKTIETGRMTYYSRSRDSLWVKGETSGHYQYVKALQIDCDKDTMLAKVKQVGVACHTGNKTCFYTDLIQKQVEQRNPYRILSDVYETIMERKENPKEGSYTNYLFDKGIDKILKKCGEEATEIVIAAKNPNSEELKYEIADFLYHMMVLMAECNLDWEDIVTEMVHRR